MNDIKQQMEDIIDNLNIVSYDGITMIEAAKQCTDVAIKFAIGYNAWYNKLTPSQKCTVHAPAGSGCGTGLYEKDDQQLIESYIKTLKQLQK